jgi:hypothetical protein
MTIWDNIALVLFGWLLGMLGPAAVEAIRIRRLVRATEAALAVELDELQIRLADNVFYIADHMGVFDHKLVRWLLASYREYRGLYVDAAAVQLLQQLAQVDDAALARMNVTRRTFGSGDVLVPRKFGAPVVQQILITSLAYLERELQQKLLEIVRQLAILEEDIEQIREQYRFTFDERAASKLASGIGDNIARSTRHAMSVSMTVADLAQSIVLALRAGA